MSILNGRHSGLVHTTTDPEFVDFERDPIRYGDMPPAQRGLVRIGDPEAAGAAHHVEGTDPLSHARHIVTSQRNSP